MVIEQGEKVRNFLENASETITEEQLEKLLVVKEPRLPKSIRRYIQRLKQAGYWEVAMGFRAEEMKKAKKKRGIETREERARKELFRTIRQIIETDDPQVEVEGELKAIWLLDVSGAINQEERLQELRDLLDSKAPELQAFLAENMIRIREQTTRI